MAPDPKGNARRAADRAFERAADEALQSLDFMRTDGLREQQAKYVAAGVPPIPQQHTPDAADTKVTSYLPDQRVIISGLKARPELNGTTGTIVSYNSEKGRYGVCLADGRNESIGLKPENITPASAPSALDERVGRAVVEKLADEEDYNRASLLKELDAEGAYAVAVAHGLHRALASALAADVHGVAARWMADAPVSFMHHATTTIFRGERHRTDGGFGAVDAARVCAFLHAEPRGWSLLLDAAIAVAKVLADPRVKRRSEALHTHSHRAARDSWVFFTLCLVHRPIAKAILRVDAWAADEPLQDAEVEALLDETLDHCVALGLMTEAQVDDLTDALALGQTSPRTLLSEHAPTLSAAIAEQAAKKLALIMGHLSDAPEHLDPGSVIEANAMQTSAMLSYWVKELRVRCAFESVLNLPPDKRAMYLKMSKPMGEATIRKGRFLTQEETMKLLTRGGR